MRCEICSRGIEHGVALHRQNEKGVKAVWRCTDCNMKPIDPEIEELLNLLGGQPPKKVM